MLTNAFGILQKNICLVTGKITNSPKTNAEKLLLKKNFGKYFVKSNENDESDE